MAKAVAGLLVDGARGKLGGVVLARQPDGSLVVREWTLPRDPETPAQVAVRRRVAAASKVWASLTDEEAAAWEAYAKALQRTARRPGDPVAVRPMNVFLTLATKLLQADPGAAVPRTPPGSAFGGDACALSVEGLAGAVRFTSDRANAAGVATELLVQPLRSRRTKPTARGYRSGRFVRFEPGSLAADVAALPGWAACAARFVRLATGQSSGLMPLGVVEVLG
jgi:hypothetical protein